MLDQILITALSLFFAVLVFGLAIVLLCGVVWAVVWFVNKFYVSRVTK